MKKLTKAQLEELRIFNPWNFCGGICGGYCMSFTAQSRQTMGSFGWHLTGPGITRRSQWDSSANVNTSARGREFDKALLDAKPIFDALGVEAPTEWIKFMGAWIPKDFYEKRMAALVKLEEQNKETK